MSDRRDLPPLEQVLVLVGKRVRQLREERKWAQVDLAAHIDEHVQRTMISDLETGRRRPSLATLILIAQALDVPVAALFLDPSSRLQDRAALRILQTGDDALAPVAKLLDLEP